MNLPDIVYWTSVGTSESRNLIEEYWTQLSWNFRILPYKTGVLLFQSGGGIRLLTLNNLLLIAQIFVNFLQIFLNIFDLISYIIRLYEKKAQK